MVCQVDLGQCIKEQPWWQVGTPPTQRIQGQGWANWGQKALIPVQLVAAFSPTSQYLHHALWTSLVFVQSEAPVTQFQNCTHLPLLSVVQSCSVPLVMHNLVNHQLGLRKLMGLLLECLQRIVQNQNQRDGLQNLHQTAHCWASHPHGQLAGHIECEEMIVLGLPQVQSGVALANLEHGLHLVAKPLAKERQGYHLACSHISEVLHPHVHNTPVTLSNSGASLFQASQLLLWKHHLAQLHQATFALKALFHPIGNRTKDKKTSSQRFSNWNLRQ